MRPSTAPLFLQVDFLAGLSLGIMSLGFMARRVGSISVFPPPFTQLVILVRVHCPHWRTVLFPTELRVRIGRSPYLVPPSFSMSLSFFGAFPRRFVPSADFAVTNVCRAVSGSMGLSFIFVSCRSHLTPIPPARHPAESHPWLVLPALLRCLSIS